MYNFSLNNISVYFFHRYVLQSCSLIILWSKKEDKTKFTIPDTFSEFCSPCEHVRKLYKTSVVEYKDSLFPHLSGKLEKPADGKIIQTKVVFTSVTHV